MGADSAPSPAGPTIVALMVRAPWSTLPEQLTGNEYAGGAGWELAGPHRVGQPRHVALAVCSARAFADRRQERESELQRQRDAKNNR